jgi:hypothetical protein
VRVPLAAPLLQIKAAMEELQKEVMALGQAVYGQQQGGAAPGADAGSSSGPKGDDVIDAGEPHLSVVCVTVGSSGPLPALQPALQPSAAAVRAPTCWPPLHTRPAEFTDSDKK